MRNEFAPFNVKVVTIVTGGVKSNLFQNAAVIAVPQSSPYFPIRHAIENRTFLSGHKDMPGNEYARKVVGDLLNKPRPFIWRGAFATLIWFIWCFGWVGMLVSFLSRDIIPFRSPLRSSKFRQRSSDRSTFRTMESKSEPSLPNSRLLKPPTQRNFYTFFSARERELNRILGNLSINDPRQGSLLCFFHWQGTLHLSSLFIFEVGIKTTETWNKCCRTGIELGGCARLT